MRPAVPRSATHRRAVAFVALGVLLCLGGATVFSLPARQQPPVTTLSIVGTTDLHGRIFAEQGRGGLALLGGYLANLRAARAADGGAVLLLDSGDTYQGGLDSNLSEGAVVVDAYNALGYAAAAIGNHDFEFGPVDEWGLVEMSAADRRGALKARAAQARFPFLAANLREGDLAVAWPNVRPSTMVEAAGVKVGIVGVMTDDALSMTLPANVAGLRVTPLAGVIAVEATALRAAGADVVVVAAHAGGECSAFDDPADLSTCDDTAEIFDAIRRLPRGLVDVVMAGHTHAGVAHEVNGVAVAQAYSWGRAFSRVDLSITRAADGTISAAPAHRIFPPRAVCTWEDAAGQCVASAAAGMPSRYEGRAVMPDHAVDAAMAPALARVAAVRAAPLGVTLDTLLPRGSGAVESPLGNLFADAFRDLLPGTDAALSYASGPGGLRTDVPAGAATVGAFYDVFPFDNLVVRRTLTGAELKQLLAGQVRRPRFGGRALGVSGLRVRLQCHDGVYQAEAERESGEPVRDDDRLVVAMSDFLAARATAMSPSAALSHGAEPLAQMRDVVTAWLRTRGDRVQSGAFADAARPRWTQPASCGPI